MDVHYLLYNVRWIIWHVVHTDHSASYYFRPLENVRKHRCANTKKIHDLQNETKNRCKEFELTYSSK